MPLYMVRHGSSRLNAGDPSDPTAYFRGWSGVTLSPHGNATMEQTAQYFKDKKVGHIVTSDLPRAQESAAKIQKTTGAPVTADPRLRPWHIGDMTGQKITPELLKLSKTLQEKQPGVPAPGGEAYNDFLKRYAGGLKDLLAAASNDTIVAVAHHRNAMALDSLLYGKPTRSEGPPEPGEAIQVTPHGVKRAYLPPKQRGKKESAPNASS